VRKILLVALIAVEFVHAQAGAQSVRPPSPNEWTSYGLTPGETRYSPLKQIDASKRQPSGPRVVLRSRPRRRRPGGNTPILERHPL
jgi:hypothetical protein